MQLAGLLAVVLAVIQREIAWLVLAGAAVAWVVVEIAFALHGFPASPRYMFEPVAVMVVLAGAAVGRLLAIASPSWLARAAGAAAVIALVAALGPQAQLRARLFDNGVVLGRNWARQLQRLQLLIAREGGPARIISCGQPVTGVIYQSILAWDLGRNDSGVGWNPPAEIRKGWPIVFFKPVWGGLDGHPYPTATPPTGRAAAGWPLIPRSP